MLLVVIAGVVAAFVYEIVLTGGATGQTIGKRVVGIRVIDLETGGPIGGRRAFGRALCRGVFTALLQALVGVIDFIWMLWDRERQTLHDKVARAIVVPVSAYPVSQGELVEPPGPLPQPPV